ncbi:MAG: efflux RND transporter permease subunit [Spirochaetaceae bacterium]|nr:MAG: efflux RND transporter permease subunit [Spirochaetaceae bacterium]
MNLGRFSVNNPVLINILMVLLLVAGYFSVTRLPQEQFSDVPFYFVNIAVPYPGVSAADIERTVTVPIENTMQGIDRVDTIRSVTTEGLSRVTLEFDQGISRQQFDRLFQEVRNRFNSVSLPDDVLQESITEFTSNDFVPVIEVVLVGEIDYAALNRAARELKTQLEQVREVSGITLVGARDRQIVIDAEPARLQGFGVSLDEIAAAVRSRNVTVPGGVLETPSRSYLLRTVGEIDRARDFDRIIVRHAADRGGVVTVGDVAAVQEGFDREGVKSRYNGRQSITLRVLKIPGGSSVDIAEAVRGRVQRFQQRSIGEGVEVFYSNDSTIQIRDSIDVLVTNALMGLVLLVVILLLFIGLRNALMTALGIPLTFAVTFIVLELTGDTLNSNTLFAMVLVLGLIVDHAIVIVENSYRLRSEGLSRHDAAIKGVNQVILPVIAATATTVAAFLPLAFLPGVIGRFLRVVPLTVTIALIASTAEAGLFIPSHFAEWPGGKKTKQAGRIFLGFQGFFVLLLRRLYRFRLVTLAVMLLVMIGSFALVGRLGQNLFAADDASLFFIDIDMPAGTPIDRTDEVVQSFEQRLIPYVGDGEVIAVRSSVGFAAGTAENVTQANVGQVVVELKPTSRGRERTVAQIMSDLELVVADIPGPEDVRVRRQATGPPTDPPVVYRLFGDSYENLMAVSDRIKAEMGQYPELFNIRDNLEQSSPELRVTVDDTIAASYGLSRQAVGNFVRGAFDGIDAGTVFTDNEETAVLVRYAQTTPAGVEQLLQRSIATTDGRMIPFSSVARVDEGDVFASIRRLDGRREVTIESEAFSTEWLRELDSEVRTLFNEQLAEQYPDVELVVGGEFAQFARVIFDILRVFLVGIFIIYTILGTQFKSYTQPLLILFSVPFAFVGVVLFLVIGGQSISTTIIYAGVALAGIAVNDTIVLISFINDLRAQGMMVGQAVIEAARIRLRPIILTSLTTIGGLIPTAIGAGGRSVIWGPMASTIIFGLLFSTITALIIIPCIYGVFYDRGPARSTGGASEARA